MKIILKKMTVDTLMQIRNNTEPYAAYLVKPKETA